METNKDCVFLSKCLINFICLPFFLGFFFYFLVLLIAICDNGKDFSSIRKIKNEKIIKDLIELIYEKYEYEKNLVIFEFSLTLFSFVLYILGWVAHILLTKLIKNKTIKLVYR